MGGGAVGKGEQALQEGSGWVAYVWACDHRQLEDTKETELRMLSEECSTHAWFISELCFGQREDEAIAYITLYNHR